MLRTSIVVVCVGSLALWVACSGDEFSPTPTGSPTAVGGGGGGTGGTGGDVGGTGGTAGGGGTGGTIQCFDNDNDGVTDCEGDCDDDDPTSYPGAQEICGDAPADNDCDGTPDQASVCQGIGAYVSQLYGDDTMGDGTQANPVATIAQGMANARTIGGGHDVFVAEGTYPEKVVLEEGISLWGGYQCDTTTCTWARDSSTYISEIANGDREGVLIDITITNATELDGFRIVGWDVSGSPTWPTPAGTAAVSVQGGTAVISNNEIVGGTETGCSSRCDTHGLRINGPMNDPVNGVLVHQNRLLGGDSNRGCSGLALIGGQQPIVKVISNWIKGGNCPYNRAVNAWSSGFGTFFYDNDIHAGTETDQQAHRTSFAMIVSGYATIDANRVNADPAEVGSCPNPAASGNRPWCGGIETEGATAIITNNVVFGMPTAAVSTAILIADGEVPFGLLTINGNTLDGGGMATGGGLQANISTALMCKNNQGVAAKVGRIANNILLGGEGVNRFAFFEDDQQDPKTCAPILYENNDLFFAPPAATDNAHRQWPAGGPANLLPTVTEVNQQAYAQNNFTDDPLLDATFHLQTGSPCIDQGTPTDAPPTDMDGEARPQGAGIDVGADEAE